MKIVGHQYIVTTSICSAQEEKTTTDLETSLALIYSHGLVHWWTPMEQSVAHCRMDITWFPLDSQSCPLVYVSWTLPSSQMNITPLEPAVDYSYYQESGEWQLTGNDARLYLWTILVLQTIKISSSSSSSSSPPPPPSVSSSSLAVSVGWSVKLYSLTHSLTSSSASFSVSILVQLITPSEKSMWILCKDYKGTAFITQSVYLLHRNYKYMVSYR